MANVTITIPDAVVDRVLDAIAGTYGYNPLLDGTKAQFGKKQLANFAKRTVRDYEAVRDSNLSYNQAIAAVESEINIT